jgi:hypothetical protein
MSTIQSKPHPLLSSQYLNGIYIPAGLLIMGVWIVKQEWIPYAVASALVLGAWKAYNNSESFLGTDVASIVTLDWDTHIVRLLTSFDPQE